MHRKKRLRKTKIVEQCKGGHELEAIAYIIIPIDADNFCGF